MFVSIKYLEGQKFSAETRNQKLTIDQPKEKGGSDEGMNPLEVFLTSLASCVGVYTKNYCKNANIDTKDLSIDISSDLTQEKPFRFADMKIKINLTFISDDRKKALLDFVKNCPIHNTLRLLPKIDFSV